MKPGAVATFDTALERDNCYVWCVVRLGPPQLIREVWSGSIEVWSAVNTRRHDGYNHLNHFP